ncbi:hypothetical protein BJV74DRAFT_982218 [Russula compacta]|nr:hypothetical protein BJV74DRAFT_982218 [Russula compacta]
MMPGENLTRLNQLVAPLRESIIDKPPYISGTLPLPDSSFSLFYKVGDVKDGHTARHINLANATLDELEGLAQACEPASFGLNKEDVLDETYRKAGKIDFGEFSATLDLAQTDLIKIIRDYLLEGTQSTRIMRTELYKLNVYGKGSFFKPHVDTPRSEKMFGSLVIVFPTPHEGGALFLRHRGNEWAFDSGRELAAVRRPSIGYVAFFSDIEHEVAPVVSGHRVTLTYNLYFDDVGPVSGTDSVAESLSLTANERTFREAFEALLENPEFLADGGTLIFGLRHVYPIRDDLKSVYKALKGSDAMVYQSVLALGFEPVLHMYYQWGDDEYGTPESAIIDKVVGFEDENWLLEEDDFASKVHQKGGIMVYLEDERFENCGPAVWVTPMTTFNCQERAHIQYGNEVTMAVAYGNVCFVVRIGGAGERLMYPTVARLKLEHERRIRESDTWD